MGYWCHLSAHAMGPIVRMKVAARATAAIRRMMPVGVAADLSMVREPRVGALKEGTRVVVDGGITPGTTRFLALETRRESWENNRHRGSRGHVGTHPRRVFKRFGSCVPKPGSVMGRFSGSRNRSPHPRPPAPALEDPGHDSTTRPTAHQYAAQDRISGFRTRSGPSRILLSWVISSTFVSSSGPTGPIGATTCFAWASMSTESGSERRNTR